MYEKCFTIFYPSVFWRPKGPPGPKFTNLGPDTQAPCIILPNFVPFWQRVYEIFVAKSRRYRWRRDRQKNKRTANYVSPQTVPWQKCKI